MDAANVGGLVAQNAAAKRASCSLLSRDGTAAVADSDGDRVEVAEDSSDLCEEVRACFISYLFAAFCSLSLQTSSVTLSSAQILC